MAAAHKILSPWGIAKLVTNTKIRFGAIQEHVGGLYWHPPLDKVEISYNNGLFPTKGGFRNYRWTLIHELGHRFDFNCNSVPPNSSERRLLREYCSVVFNRGANNGYPARVFPTQYSKTNSKELWAECFVGFLSPTSYTQCNMDPQMNTWVKKCLELYAPILRLS